jgi:hypothetical protein
MRRLRLVLVLALLAAAADKFPPLGPPGDDESPESKICPQCGTGVLRKEGRWAFCPVCKKIIGRWK